MGVKSWVGLEKTKYDQRQHQHQRNHSGMVVPPPASSPSLPQRCNRKPNQTRPDHNQSTPNQIQPKTTKKHTHTPDNHWRMAKYLAIWSKPSLFPQSFRRQNVCQSNQGKPIHPNPIQPNRAKPKTNPKTNTNTNTKTNEDKHPCSIHLSTAHLPIRVIVAGEVPPPLVDQPSSFSSQRLRQQKAALPRQVQRRRMELDVLHP